MNLRRNLTDTLAPVLLCTFVAACAVSSTSSAAQAQAPAHEPGIWQKHQYSFVYMGFTSTYSCDGLADKLKLLLLSAGARADSTSRAGACSSGYGHPDKFARAELTFYTLEPAGSSTSSPPVDGMWHAVTIGARSPRDLAAGDCELVEQFSAKVLPMFAARNIEPRTACIPHQDSGSVIDLKFEAFTAAPGTSLKPS
jgi:hypothetical protein